MRDDCDLDEEGVASSPHLPPENQGEEGMKKPFFQMWRQHAYKVPFELVNNKEFIGIYGHLIFGWHILAGFDKPCRNM